MTWNTYNSGYDGKDSFFSGYGFGGGYGYGKNGDQAYINVSKDGAVAKDLGDDSDVVRVNADQGGQVRLTFTSAEVGNGNAYDSNTMANQDGGLAVRLQLEDGAGNLTGAVSRFDDEGITFDSVRPGLTFDVRDLVSGTARGDQFEVVRLGTQQNDSLGVSNPFRAYYINAGMGDDTVTGGRAQDFLVGGAGNDTLDGRRGSDSLLGGGGKDTFVFDTRLNASINVDSVLDFSAVDVTFQLDKSVFMGLPEGPLAADAFALSTADATAEQRIIYDQGTGGLAFDVDGGARDNAVAFATLLNRPADVSAMDFFVT